MDKKSLLAIALSILILVVYQEFISYFYPPPPPAVPSSPSSPASAPDAFPPEEKSLQTAPSGSAAATETAPATTPVSAPARELTIENDVYSMVLTSLGGRLKSVRLKHYPGDDGKGSAPREMILTDGESELPLGFRLEGKDTMLSDEALRYETTSENVKISGEAQATVELIGQLANGSLVTKTFTFNGATYGIGLTVKVTDAPEAARLASLLWTQRVAISADSYLFEGPVALIDRTFTYETATDLVTEEKDLGPGRIRWGGYADTYFLAAMIPPESDTNRFRLSASEGSVTSKLSIPWNREPITYTLYVGPKDFAALNAVNTILDRAIDFGWSHFISRPLVHMLRFSHSLTGNYGIDIILLTFLVKLVFFPLSNKSFKSMAQMREVQPQMERLREQYKNDRERLNKEMMELYRNNKVNPLGGCLPMLVQMPVFFGLYQALSSAIELRQAPFFGWIQDLSLPDRLGSLDLWFIAPPGIPVLTLLMGATMLIQQAMTPMQGDPLQQKMMMLMPVIFTVMFVNFPSGLVLYWLVNNVLSITQQYAYQKGMI